MLTALANAMTCELPLDVRTHVYSIYIWMMMSLHSNCHFGLNIVLCGHHHSLWHKTSVFSYSIIRNQLRVHNFLEEEGRLT